MSEALTQDDRAQCPAFDEASSAMDVSTSGFLELDHDADSPWVDIARAGEANPLPKLLSGIRRDVDYAIGSRRAKREMFLRFTSQGLIELRLQRILLNGHPGFGTLLLFSKPYYFF